MLGICDTISAQSLLEGALDLPAPSIELSDNERAAAARIGAPEIQIFAAGELFVANPDRRVITSVTPIYVKESDRKLARVTQYRNLNATTTTRIVDLNANVVIREKTRSDLAPVLAEPEADYVDVLVRADPEIAEVLHSFGVTSFEVEPIAMRIINSNDPLHGRRVATVKLKTPRGYASIRRKILIDLTEGQIIKRMKGRLSYRVQQEFPAIRKRYWGRHFWAKGYFSTTSGNITDDVILQYLENHIDDPTDASR